MKRIVSMLLSAMCYFLAAGELLSGEAKGPWQTEWEKTIEAAKKEGKLVAGIPASADLRKSIGDTFPKRFPGIDLELTTSRGPTNASKIAAEHAAGVRYFDLLISGISRRSLFSTPESWIPSNRCLFCRKSKTPSAGMGVTSGSITPNAFFMPFRPISQKTFGTTRL